MSTPQHLPFREAVLASGLLTRPQLATALDEAARHGTATVAKGGIAAVSDAALAEQLVAMQLLTWYQAEQLKAGRSKLNLGPYLITDWIAEGGMGQVFKAVHQMMGREVAVKVLPHSRSTPDSIATFTREIRLQAQLDHPNLVRAYDAGHDGNVYYLVTEYVPGTDLRRLVRMSGRLTMQQSASIIAQAAEGLESAHERALVHRDVKPGNILVTPEGVAKVSDLGLATSLDFDRDTLSGRVVGTADYLSPEHIRTPRDIQSVSDVYSLGCALYYCITGKVPYPGGSAKDKAKRHCESTPWHPRRFSPEVSEDFVDVIADMMEKNPSRRIPSMLEVAARLEAWREPSTTVSYTTTARSSWLPPPLPTGGDSSHDELADTTDGSISLGSRGMEAPAVGESIRSGHGSDRTRAMSGGSQETAPGVADLRERRPRDETSTARHLSAILWTLVVSVPISMLVGALLVMALTGRR